MAGKDWSPGRGGGSGLQGGRLLPSLHACPRSGPGAGSPTGLLLPGRLLHASLLRLARLHRHRGLLWRASGWLLRRGVLLRRSSAGLARVPGGARGELLHARAGLLGRCLAGLPLLRRHLLRCALRGRSGLILRRTRRRGLDGRRSLLRRAVALRGRAGLVAAHGGRWGLLGRCLAGWHGALRSLLGHRRGHRVARRAARRADTADLVVAPVLVVVDLDLYRGTGLLDDTGHLLSGPAHLPERGDALLAELLPDRRTERADLAVQLGVAARVVGPVVLALADGQRGGHLAAVVRAAVELEHRGPAVLVLLAGQPVLATDRVREPPAGLIVPARARVGGVGHGLPVGLGRAVAALVVALRHRGAVTARGGRAVATGLRRAVLLRRGLLGVALLRLLGRVALLRLLAGVLRLSWIRHDLLPVAYWLTAMACSTIVSTVHPGTLP